MESPLLTKSEHNVEDVTVHGDPSSNEEHIVDITTDGDSSPADEHIVDITINGDSSSAEEQTPHEASQWSCSFINGIVWILVELAVTLSQIVAATFFLTLTKDEQHPELNHVPLLIWIICYTCASIATVPIVCCRLWQYIRTARSGTCYELIGLENFLETCFVCLVVMFLLGFLTELSSRDPSTSQHFWLWLALIAFSCIRYLLPNLTCVKECFVWPVLFLVKQLWEGIIAMIDALTALIGLIIAIIGYILFLILSIFMYICG
ncbi:hypothetical protein AtNW77_Chr1g0017271 [Arabidopsis thaliana]|uniref:Transmembrane protein n=2 Tax=Arabidopsis TaxID=3701 RepID=A0A8T2GGM2_9BRAS|nr:hypothetical protein ISN45_At01g015840 [Arabidopsis thaliana x Arabidopsis arenosa]OAP13461.1 hypothetical protein AXX17_AT1G16400 [Arabidopsis thaliana]CAD5312824.1 unnamed protein product [Arabidopsis thaliana]